MVQSLPQRPLKSASREGYRQWMRRKVGISKDMCNEILHSGEAAGIIDKASFCCIEEFALESISAEKLATARPSM